MPDDRLLRHDRRLLILRKRQHRTPRMPKQRLHRSLASPPRFPRPIPPKRRHQFDPIRHENIRNPPMLRLQLMPHRVRIRLRNNLPPNLQHLGEVLRPAIMALRRSGSGILPLSKSSVRSTQITAWITRHRLGKQHRHLLLRRQRQERMRRLSRHQFLIRCHKH